MEPLMFSWGSVVGADHVKAKKNCQDALKVIQKKDLMVAFVSDGCGDYIDSPFSEVGARLAVSILANRVVSQMEYTARWRWGGRLSSTDFWNEVQTYSLDRIDEIAAGMGGDYVKNIVNHFLFTLVGVVITPDLTVFTGVGDGYYFLNGKIHQMMVENKNNMPTYLAYNLIGSSLESITPEDLVLRPRETILTRSVNNFMIATDGLNGVLADPKKLIPGTKEEVGDPEQFWTNKKYFENNCTLGWRLNQLANEKRTMDWDERRVIIHQPIVTDDLAIVMGARF